ncbi:hypothetical protein BpHYR1_002232 [Brachionus plicatilis]|uniref:Uncharacterized protein n=1 Tax=Brachionus plicatilis TaxID=10195 RepID=A0A3M7SEK1_BRAPC|nr:hypothetical protein BpHYR1_002232 [Brachionus plicatilis]
MSSSNSFTELQPTTIEDGFFFISSYDSAITAKLGCSLAALILESSGKFSSEHLLNILILLFEG